ncbi:MAG: SBBP repeat-containing protein [Xenococcus sp. MO_188.B8]|nr:SBBP repeat-containing protein [Xenococcus sp. MO_188.B8]
MNYTVWLRQIGTSEEDNSWGIATDHEGNLYITGYTLGSLGGQNAGGHDAWVAKYDTHGNLLWTEQLGTSESDFSSGVATDHEGNLYITGYTSGSFDGQNAGDEDAWVAKYDLHGNLLWTEQLGTSESDFSSGVATDNNGNVYITGETWGSGSFDGQNYGGAWVAKYDTHGNLLWTKQLGTSEFVGSYGVATDHNGNLYLTGYTWGSFDGQNAGGHDAWVAKYDTHGNLLWTEQLGISELDYSWGIATDNNGNVYITGETWGSFDGQNAGNQDAWVAKYDTHGNLLWTEQLGTSESDFSSGVATDNNGNSYITGFTRGSFDGQNTGDGDAWVAKYDTHGNLLWTEQLGTSESDFSGSIATDNNGNSYITGFTRGSFDGQNTGDGDAWIAKLSQSYISINRFQNSSSPGRYLLAGPEESQDIRDNFPHLLEEGEAFKVSVEPEDDLMPINRFQNSKVPGAYLYAAEEESKTIRANFPHFIDEGFAFYAYDGATNLGSDFYRFQNIDVPGNYIYVGSEEREYILANFPNWVEEGIAFELQL